MILLGLDSSSCYLCDIIWTSTVVTYMPSWKCQMSKYLLPYKKVLLRQSVVFAADGEPLKLFFESLYSLFFSVYQTASIPQGPKLFYFHFCLQRQAL